MTLRDEGFRFYVNANTGEAKWIHPAEISNNGWTDCTDMGDEAFDLFMAGSK